MHSEGTNSSSFCASVNWRKSTPTISVPMAGVRCFTFVAAAKRFFFPASANSPRSFTGISSSGGHDSSGKCGYIERICI